MSSYGSGTLLVSVPALFDPNFFRTVVLLLQNSDEGTAGVIINRPTARRISELGGEFANQTVDNDHTIYSGGPVEGPLLAVHESLVCGEVQIIPGLFFSTQRDNLLPLMRQKKHRCRFVANYSGWGAGQLDDEISAGGWLVVPGTSELIFADEDVLWRKLCENLGLEVMLNARFRPDPLSNPELN